MMASDNYNAGDHRGGFDVLPPHIFIVGRVGIESKNVGCDRYLTFIELFCATNEQWPFQEEIKSTYDRLAVFVAVNASVW